MKAHQYQSIIFVDSSAITLLPVPQQSKMQTDQDGQQAQAQADVQKETEEKTPQENEEMDVRFVSV